MAQQIPNPMKASILTLLLSLFSFILFAQIAQKTWLLNGNASVTTSLDKGSDNSNFNVAPTVGYFITNRFLIGTDFYYNYAKLGSNASNNSFNFAPFIRYYLSPSDLRLVWFANAGYTAGVTTFDFGQFEDKSNFDVLYGGIGLDYFLNANTAIEGNLQFQQNLNDTRDASSLSYKAGLQFFIPVTLAENSDNIAIAKGARLIGLTASGGWFDIGGADDLSLSVNPSLGFFITDRWVVGSGLFLGFARENAIFEPQPFTRYYIGNTSAYFQPFAAVGFSPRFQFADKTSESSFFNFNITGGIGLDYFFTSTVALEGVLGYNGRQIEDKENKQQFLNFQIGLQFFLAADKK